MSIDSQKGKEERINAIKWIITQIIHGQRNIEEIKKIAGKRFSLDSMIRNSEILSYFPKEKLTDEILKLIKKRPMRTLSGVTPIAVMIKPEGSCRWNCIYCPFTGKAAKSYTGFEPAARRARQFNFDPYLQTLGRIRQFQEMGHPTEKCEIIVMGGTFLQMPEEYQSFFIKRIYDALNERNSSSIEEAKRLNENSKHRVVGLTIETRPDVCGKEEINRILDFGATRVELGVQHPDDEIYKKINRGHGIKEVIKATALLKDSAFKIVYHLMPGLPGSSKKKDIEMFKEVFSREEFMPDMLKIYPTLILENTELYNQYKRGEFQPLSLDDIVDIIVELYRLIPPFVRIMRIQRDIPTNLLVSGSIKKSNLRELVENRIKEKGIKTKEIRFREVGLRNANIDKLELFRFDYSASKGKEIFLSYETPDREYIAGFIRLRIPHKPFRPEIDAETTALIRELHVYGGELRIGQNSGKNSFQHLGLGRSLLKEGERIAKEEFGKEKMVIISGVGVRRYYYKLGYSLDGPYVSKSL